MGLSSDLLSQFAKVTNDNTKDKKETSTVYGTVVDAGTTTYVQLDGSSTTTPVSTTVNVTKGDRVIVMIKNHTATITGNLHDPSVNSKNLDESNADVNNRITELGIAVADRVTTDQLNAVKATITDEMVAKDVVVQDTLKASIVEVDERLKAADAEISGKLTAAEGQITDLKTNKLSVEDARATYATVENLSATNTEVNNLKATHADFEKATANNFTAVNADIANLEADKLDADKAEITYAKISELDSAVGRIDHLESEVGDIDTLIFGSATGTTIQTSFANAVIAQLGAAQIKSAMIESISAEKITAGDIDTNKVRVVSEDGKLLISDETIQIKDDTRVRVQIGKDASDDYSINIWDADGNLMFSKGGITDSAIKEAIIRNDMVSEDANIHASKLDIDSLFEEINESSKTIKSTRIYLDDEKQTLDVAFKEITSEVSDIGETVSSQGTDISVLQGQISSKVWQQDINTATDEMSTQYSSLEQEVDSVKSTVASHDAAISKKADTTTVTTVSDKVSALEQNLDGFQTTVSETYATKDEVNSIEVGGRNLMLDSEDGYDFTGKSFNNSTHSGTKIICTVEGGKADHYCMVTNYIAPTPIELSKEIGTEITFSADVKIVGTIEQAHITFDLRNSNNQTRIAVIRAYADPSITDRWQRISGTATITDSIDDIDRALIALLYNSATIGSTIEYRRVKLERGNKSTDWTPAPEDVDINIDNLNERVSAAETTITQHSEAITVSATKTEVLIAKSEAVSEANTNTDNLLKGYSTTAEMNAAIQLKAEGITSSVSSTYATKESLTTTNTNVTAAQQAADKAQTDIDSLSIGGRNYASINNMKRYAGGILYTPLLYYTAEGSKIIATNQPQSGPIPGFQIKTNGKYAYTISGSTDLSTVFMYYKCFDADGNEVQAQHSVSRATVNGLFEIQFNVPDTTNYFNIGIGSSSMGAYYLDYLKIEQGTRATDWTPAPEDMATAEEVEKAQATADEAGSVASNAETLVKQLSDSISMLVTDGNGTSLMTQTEDGWTFSTSNIQSSVNDISEALDSLTTEVGDVNNTVDILQQAVNDLGAIAEYVYITTYEDEPCIELGESDSEFKLRITNTRMMFTEGSTVLAYFTNQAFNSKKVVIEEELQQGGYVWKTRSNGHLGLTWKGGNT